MPVLLEDGASAKVLEYALQPLWGNGRRWLFYTSPIYTERGQCLLEEIESMPGVCIYDALP